MKVWKTLLIAAMVLGLAAFTVGAVAAARGDGSSSTSALGPGMMLRGGAPAERQVQPGGMMRGWGNAQAPGQMLKLMEEHAKDMAAWWQKYGKDPTSAAAQKALQQLRAEHRSDMQKYRGQAPGSTTSPAPGTAPYGPGMMNGGTGGGMMGGW